LTRKFAQFLLVRSEQTKCASDWILAHFLCAAENGASDRYQWLSHHAGQALYTNGILLRGLPCDHKTDYLSSRKQCLAVIIKP
jgi:hypothetical protein